MPTEADERFNALYEDTKAEIVAYVMRRATTREDAADVIAETYEVAWRRLVEVPSGHDGLLWLYVTARHILANHGRRLRRNEAIVSRLAEALCGVDPCYKPLDEEALTAWAALAILAPDQREIVMLAAWEGLDAGEIGRVLGCSPTAARIRLHRARARLRAEVLAPAGPVKHRPGTRHGRNRDTQLGCVPGEAQG